METLEADVRTVDEGEDNKSSFRNRYGRTRVRVNTPMSDAEWATRCDLAACFRLADHYGYTDMIYGHFSALVPGEEGRYLMNPFGLSFSEVTASNLIKLDFEGNIIGETPLTANIAGVYIHNALHKARPDVGAVLHTHSETGMAISMLECGLLPASQHAIKFYNRVGYLDYEGLPIHDNQAAEMARLVAALGQHNAVILRNHGFLTTGRTIADGFTEMFMLEKAAAAQLRAMATGIKIAVPPPQVCEQAARDLDVKENPSMECEWPALLRMLDRKDPSYKT